MQCRPPVSAALFVLHFSLSYILLEVCCLRKLLQINGSDGVHGWPSSLFYPRGKCLYFLEGREKLSRDGLGHSFFSFNNWVVSAERLNLTLRVRFKTDSHKRKKLNSSRLIEYFFGDSFFAEIPHGCPLVRRKVRYQKLPDVVETHRNKCWSASRRLCTVFVVTKPPNTDNSVNVMGYRNIFHERARVKPPLQANELRISVHIRRGDIVGNLKRTHKWISNAAYFDLLRSVFKSSKSSSIHVILHVEGWRPPAYVPDIYDGKFTDFSPLQHHGATVQFGPKDETEALNMMCGSHILIASISDFSFLAALLCEYTITLAVPRRTFLTDLENVLTLEPLEHEQVDFHNRSIRVVSRFSFCAQCVSDLHTRFSQAVKARYQDK